MSDPKSEPTGVFRISAPPPQISAPGGRLFGFLFQISAPGRLFAVKSQPRDVELVVHNCCLMSFTAKINTKTKRGISKYILSVN